MFYGHFPIGILGQVWYLIVSIPDLCTLTYLWYFSVDGVMGLWSKWSDCYCDGIAQGSYGAKTRTRVCNLAGNGGNFCWGALSENQPCYGDCM